MPEKRKQFGGDPRRGTSAGRAVFDPYEEVATGAGAGTAAGRQMVGPGAGAGGMAGRTLAGLDAQRAVDDANALAGWYEAMAYPAPSPEEAYMLWGDDSANLGYGPGPGGGTRMGYEQAIMVDPRLDHLGMGASGRDPRLESPYGRQMVRGMAPSPDYINAQRVLGVNRIMGY